MDFRVEGDFYSADDWEPDGPSLFDLIQISGNGVRRVILDEWQVHLVQTFLGQEGLSRKQAQTFIDRLVGSAKPMVDHMNKVGKIFTDLHAQCEPILADMKPPKNGPRYNPHARRGKGGRR